MNEKQEEKQQKTSNKTNQFIELIANDIDLVISCLSDIDILKPLIWKNSKFGGGKLSTRRLAIKYGVSRTTVRRVLTNIKKQKEC